MALESQRPRAQIAVELSISDDMLHGWINKQNQAESQGMTTEELRSEQEEIQRLR